MDGDVGEKCWINLHILVLIASWKEWFGEESHFGVRVRV
jgi:hypothetical protein